MEKKFCCSFQKQSFAASRLHSVFFIVTNIRRSRHIRGFQYINKTPLTKNCPLEYACLPLVIRRDKTLYFVSNGPRKPGAFLSRCHRHAMEYRHVILKKEDPTEKLAANDNGVIWRARGNNLWRKVYFSGSGVMREKTNKTDFYKGLLFLNPVTFVRPLAEFPLFIYALHIRYIHG